MQCRWWLTALWTTPRNGFYSYPYFQRTWLTPSERGRILPLLSAPKLRLSPETHSRSTWGKFTVSTMNAHFPSRRRQRLSAAAAPRPNPHGASPPGTRPTRLSLVSVRVPLWGSRCLSGAQVHPSPAAGPREPSSAESHQGRKGCAGPQAQKRA